MNQAPFHLAFHGAVVLLIGLLMGAPYARAIQRGAPAHVVNSWRVAHASLPMGALLMLSVAGLLLQLPLPSALAWTLTALLVISGYAFCVSTPLAALTGERGLGQGSQGWGRLVYLGNMAGAWTSLAAAVCLVAATGLMLITGSKT